MLIVKFLMISLLLGLTLMLALRPRQGPPVGGPHWYMDVPGSANPIRPSARLGPGQLKRVRRVWWVWFDSRSCPVKWQLREDGKVIYAEELFWDRPGHLRARRAPHSVWVRQP